MSLTGTEGRGDPFSVLCARCRAFASLHDQRRLLRAPDWNQKEGGPFLVLGAGVMPSPLSTINVICPDQQVLYVWRVWERFQPSLHQGSGPIGPFLQCSVQPHYDTSSVGGAASQPP